MSFVNTTLGLLPIEKLGRVNIHEHIILDGSQNPNVPDDFHHVDADLISHELMNWKKAGGGVLVDSSPICAGRNITKLEEASRLSQVPIIITSGFHKLTYYHPDHWLFSVSEHDIFDIIFRECIHGIMIDDRDPFQSNRSQIKAYMLKIGIDHQGINPLIGKMISSITSIMNELEIPCMIHTEPGIPFHDVIKKLTSFSINPKKWIFCHLGKSLDVRLFLEMAKSGFYLEFDEMIRPAPPLKELAAAILELFNRGYGNRVLFAGDFARRSYWSCYKGSPGLEFLVSGLSDQLKNNGFSQEMLDQIWIHNPQALFY